MSYFYSVNNVPFYSKVLAILEAERLHSFPHFIFHDDVYSKYKWDVEPTEDLGELYARRARELREKYDYLILQYSGGADSHNILETFIKNKLQLDEILIRGAISTTEKNPLNTSNSNGLAESYFNSYPGALEAKRDHYPNLKISIVDTRDFVLDFYSKNKDWYDPTKFSFNSFTTSMSWKADIDSINPDYQKLTNAGKKVAFIIGIDKPGVYFENGEFKLRFLDKTLNIHLTNRNTSIDLPNITEPFYWAESTAPLIIKQAHTIKNYFRAHKLNPSILSEENSRKTNDFISSIIYKRTTPIRWTVEKSVGGTALLQYDDWIARDKNSIHFQNWQTGMNQLNNIVPANWKHDGDIFKDLVGIWSKSYSIGK